MLNRWDEEERRRALHMGVGLSSPLWSAAFFAVGFGAAWWWWTQSARRLVGEAASPALSGPLGPSPERARPSPAGQSGEAAVEVAPPELVMAHAAPPPEAPDRPAHPSDDAIPEPPPEMLAHTPPESLGLSFKPGSGFDNPTRDPNSALPDRGSGESAPKPRTRRKPGTAPET